MSNSLYIRCECGANVQAPTMVVADNKLISPITHCKRSGKKYVIKSANYSGRTIATAVGATEVDIKETKQILHG